MLLCLAITSVYKIGAYELLVITIITKGTIYKPALEEDEYIVPAPSVVVHFSCCTHFEV